ncbi:MAG: thioredoxin [Planctomycetota bacterium]|nr:MAG: thioredoxin [Planctomycetota bacterium]
MSQVEKITSKEFDEKVLKADLPVVVDFYADWCAPCKMLAPILDSMAEKFEGKVKFVKVNTDENPDLREKYQIMGVPTLMFFKNGKKEDVAVGLLPVEALAEKIRKHAGVVVDK